MISNNNNGKSNEMHLLVATLPEVYQPIFGHPEFAADASRRCDDRFTEIKSIYQSLEKLLGRPLKVLDLGCAQGYFSFSLASMGAIVKAIDYSAQNIAICQFLAQEHQQLHINFELTSIDLFIKNIQDDDYDLVLGLSVFHHLIHEHGLDYVGELFVDLRKKIVNGFFEMALRAEPLYWNEAQPEDPRFLIRDFNFIIELSTHGTHLSEIVRPLYFVSSNFWILGDDCGEIIKVTEKSHALDNEFHQGTRRFIFTHEKIIKVFRLDSERGYINEKELSREIKFLSNPIQGIQLPTLISYGRTRSDFCLIRSLLEGESLVYVVQKNLAYNPDKVLSSLLEKIATLEENGMYHGDLRPWNILLTPDGTATFIDYGAISNTIEDGDDLYGQILRFLVLAREITSRQIRNLDSQRPLFVNPNDFEGIFHNWILCLWSTPSSKWTFRLVLDLYIQCFKSHFKKQTIDQLNIIEGITESTASVLFNVINYKISVLDKEIKNLSISAMAFEERRAVTAEQRAAVLEQRVSDQENRAVTAELRASDQERRAITVEQRAAVLEQRVLDQENRAVTAELRASDQERRAITAEQRAAVLEQRVSDQENRAVTAEFANHQNLQQSNEWHEQVLAIHSSTSWQITKPLRALSRIVRRQSTVGEVSTVSTTILRQFIRSRVVSAIKWAGDRTRSSPGFNRFVFRLLRRYPGLQQKLRKVYMENQGNDLLQPANWSGASTDAVTPFHRDVTGDKECVMSQPAPNGVNANQQTPLESSFHTYRDQP